jgi:hypothetical protein
MVGSGLGFSLPPETFCVLPVDSSSHFIAGKSWFLDWLMHEGHMICCAVVNKSEKNELIIIPSDLTNRLF